MNKALGDLQSEKITNHEYVAGVRQLSDEEYSTAQERAAIAAAEAEKKKQEAAAKRELYAKRAEWVLSKFGETIAEYEEKESLEKDVSVSSTTAVDIGTIVRTTYSNGTVFYINYNEFPVVTEDGISLEANSFIRID